GNDDDLRHPRPGRGDDAGRPHRCAEGRLYRGGRLADGPLPHSRKPLRDAVHRFPRDEHHPRYYDARSRGSCGSTCRGGNCAGAAVSFGVRPEDLRLAGEGDDVLFDGTVDYVEQLGEVQLVYVEIGRAGDPLVAKLPGNSEVERGARMRLTASGGDLHLFDAD